MLSLGFMCKSKLLYCVYTYVGDAGRHSDGGILSNCAFGQALEDGNLNMPEDLPLPGL